MNAAEETREDGNTPENQNGEWHRGLKRRLPALLGILALLFVISSVIAGILLGNKTGRQEKPAADSFVIGDGEGGRDRLHLAGRISLADGTPFADGKLELHSVVQEGKTDSHGWFLFEEVEAGAHSLFILDEEGKTLAEVKVELKRNQENEYSSLRIEKTAENQYRLQMSREIRYIELDLELNRGVLTIRMDKTAAVDGTGTVSLPAQTMEAKKGPVILPSGTSVMRDGRILHGRVMILPDNQVVRIPKEGIMLSDGTMVAEDGTITFPDGTAVAADGIRYQNQETVDFPEYPIQLTDPEVESGKEELNPTVQAGQGEESGSEKERLESGSPMESETPAEGNLKEESTKTPEETGRSPDKVESDDPSETLAPDYGDLGVYYEENGAWSVWKDERSIRLFDYMPGQTATSSTSLPVIKPGDSGYYPFEVTNTFSSHTVKIRVTVTEETIHLPLSFRLVTVGGGGQETAVSDWSSPLSGGGAVTVANANASPPGSTVRYHLQWRWPYESGRDGADTAAARLSSDQSRTYTLKMEINARR